MTEVTASDAGVLTPPVEPAFATFTGTGREYFPIWAVNLVLTVITLGLYSPWAKVRRTRWFYRHTRIAGSGFDYHGSPLAIFKGRLVALGLLGLYTLTGYVTTTTALVILVLLAVALPWLLAQSLRFRLANTSWRGIRFAFRGSTADAYGVFLLWPIAAFGTLFALYPMWKHRLRRYQLGHAAFGTARSSCEVTTGAFYAAYVQMAVLGVVLIMFAGAITGGLSVAVSPTTGIVFLLSAYALVVVGLGGFLAATLDAATWQSTFIGSHRVFVRVKGRTLAGLQLRNILLTVLTLGLYRPFAQVRVAEYYASCMELAPGQPIEQIEAVNTPSATATGDAAMEFFDLDVAL
jgi:uncharacterized membrane protein YjgN (DUF898 family)